MSVERHLLTRRRFLTLALAAAPGVSLTGNIALDQTHLRVSRFNLRASASPSRFVHISDLHYRGDTGFSDSIITAIPAVMALRFMSNAPPVAAKACLCRG